ncbi:MAG: adenylosuccinate lyase [Planctomycetales bacterium]|nr:adenylosuccinate lyase [bacterium]UNM09816.1 MAG: adenylosuccinate lyase [Planctomycetales bacterium]
MIDRYTRPPMGRLFTAKHRFDTWLKVELAVCEAWAERGEIPQDAWKRIRKNANYKLKRINEIEAAVHHDVIAFNTAVADYIGEDSAYFHKGMTSNDVVDTAQCLILKEAGQLIEEGLIRLRKALGARALEYRHTPVMGRTHGVHAEPTTFGLKLLVWYDELNRHEERLALAIDGLAVGKLSGAVGNFAHIPPDLEEQILRKLGLQSAPVSNQVVQRDRHAHFVMVLAGLASTMEKIAVNLRSYQRTEIGEVQEPFAKGQKGSSAMPHKKNPILLERITGLSRVIRGYAVTALENVALWDERDISHSGAERVILPDACILVDYMMDKLSTVIGGLVVRPEQMNRNIYLTKGLIFSQRVLLALTEAGVSREDAYSMVQRNAMRCWEDRTPLLDALLNDRDVRSHLDTAQISSLFTIDPFLEHVDRLFERVGLSDGKKHSSDDPKPVQAPRRGRGRGRRKDDRIMRSEQGNIDSIAVDTGAIQNISERASDYYESASVVLSRTKSDAPKGDDTLGEAEHQKKKVASEGTGKPASASRSRSRSKPRTDKDKDKVATEGKDNEKPSGVGSSKPAPPADALASADEEKAAKPRRRRRRSPSRKPAEGGTGNGSDTKEKGE